VRNHAVEALIQRRGHHDNHFAFCFAESIVFIDEGVVKREERAELLRAMRKREENVWHETRLLLHFFDACANVRLHRVKRRNREAAYWCRRLVFGGLLAVFWRLRHSVFSLNDRVLFNVEF
jgi:hypothetical protein